MSLLRHSIRYLVFLSLAGISQTVPFFLKTHYCSSEACEQFGFYTHSNLNKTRDPCVNFYDFSCGGWTSQAEKPQFEPIWNPWVSASSEINLRQLEILESRPADNAMAKAQTFYNTCMRTGPSEVKYLKGLKMLIQDLHGWPMVSRKWNVQGYSFIQEVMRITKLLGIRPILNVHVDIDYKNPTKHILYIEPGNLVFPHYILVNPLKYAVELEAYEKWIFESVKHMYPNINPNKTKQSVREMIKFEIRLAKLTEGKSRSERMSLKKLTKKYPITDWLKSLNLLFEGTDNVRITLNDTVVIRNCQYLKNLFVLIGKTKSKIVADYLMWTVVKDLSRETTTFMRNLNFIVDKAVLGVQLDLSRQMECVSKTVQFFSFSFVPQYAELHVNPRMMSQVRGMADAIKVEFVRAITNSSWLSPEAKNLSVEKAKNIRHVIGFPAWATDRSSVQLHYRQLNISENHFLNVLKMKNFLAEEQLAKLNKNVSEIEWPSTVFDVNAYYSILQNAIFIPLGLLLPPFFHDKQPEILNYGALGSLIGHELSHSLDTSGRQADQNGKIRKWWSLEDINQYEERAQCFFQQYNSSRSPILAENIADSVGIKVSLAAFRKTASAKYLSIIKHLENYTYDQLFFISFAQIWCEISDRVDIFFEEDHPTVPNRVSQTLLNNDDFSKAFDCNTRKVDNKCKLW